MMMDDYQFPLLLSLAMAVVCLAVIVLYGL
jgi:hypothetical protein